MTRQKLAESNIPMEMKTSVNTQLRYEWDPSDTEPIMKCIFKSIAKFLGLYKTKDGNGKCALLVQDYKGNMLLGAIVTYVPGESETDVGNWALSFTFDPEDVKGINPTHTTNDQAFIKVLFDVTLELIHYRYTNSMLMNDITILSVELLRNALDKNAIPDDEFVIEIPGYIDAVVRTTDDHKVMTIEPSESLSRLIKGDEEIEV